MSDYISPGYFYNLESCVKKLCLITSLRTSLNAFYVYFYMLQPVKMLDDFLRLAKENTARNLETCGVLAGSLVIPMSVNNKFNVICMSCLINNTSCFQRNRVFHLTTLIIPKQESTSDSVRYLLLLFINAL